MHWPRPTAGAPKHVRFHEPEETLDQSVIMFPYAAQRSNTNITLSATVYLES